MYGCFGYGDAKVVMFFPLGRVVMDLKDMMYALAALLIQTN